MWVKFHRNSLQLLGNHTTNRIERQFLTLKLSLSETFGTMPKTVDAIIHLLNFTNDHLAERRIFNSTKSLRIYDSDEFICALNNEASLHLNEHVCLIYHRSLKLLSGQGKNMIRCENGGVKEMFKDGSSKIYAVTTEPCHCTFH